MTPEFILNECLDGNDSQCAQVKRGAERRPVAGVRHRHSGHIVSLLDNLAVEEVQGYDITVGYDLPLSVIGMGRWGRLRFSDILSITSTWDQQELQGARKVDCAGNWGATCGFPTPDIRNNLRATWVTPWGVRPSLMWRYISGVEDLNSTQVDLGRGTTSTWP